MPELSQTDQEKITEVVKIAGEAIRFMSDDKYAFLLEFYRRDEYFSQRLLPEALDLMDGRVAWVLDRIERYQEPPTAVRTDGTLYPLLTLETVGLTGSELALKHYVITTLWTRLQKTPRLHTLRRLLDALGTFLGSLASALIGVDPIAELQDILKAILKVKQRKDTPDRE